MIAELHNYYLNKEEPIQGCLLALRSIILQQDKDITETRKWGMPCFCYKQKMFCFLWTDKKTDHPYILMVEGNLLDHPALEQGDRTRMKIFRVDPYKDLPKKTINIILQAALKIRTFAIMGYAKERGKLEKLLTKVSELINHDEKSLTIITDIYEQFSHAVRILKNKNTETFNQFYESDLQKVKEAKKALKQTEEDGDRQANFIKYKEALISALENTIQATKESN